MWDGDPIGHTHGFKYGFPVAELSTLVSNFEERIYLRGDAVREAHCNRKLTPIQVPSERPLLGKYTGCKLTVNAWY